MLGTFALRDEVMPMLELDERLIEDCNRSSATQPVRSDRSTGRWPATHPAAGHPEQVRDSERLLGFKLPTQEGGSYPAG
jgi:hypothetical protein